MDVADPTIQPLVKLAMSEYYTRNHIENILNKASQWTAQLKRILRFFKVNLSLSRVCHNFCLRKNAVYQMSVSSDQLQRYYLSVT